MVAASREIPVTKYVLANHTFEAFPISRVGDEQLTKDLCS